MNAAEKIAAALGGYPSSGGWWRCRCPAHGSNRASLALRDGERGGIFVHCHAGCARADIFAELRQRGIYSAGASGPAPAPDPEAERRRAEAEAAHVRRRIAEALDIWRESHPAEATGQVPRYLRSRGIMVPIPPTIRVHGMHGPYGRHPSGGRWPQMIALVEHVEHGLVGVSRTFLRPDGSGKAAIDPERMFKGAVKGGAVRLGTVTPDEWLAIGEGVETVLSVMQARELPGWAALSAGGLENLILPPEADKVLIAADNDANGRGQRAARAAALRWVREGRRVRIALPPAPGTDFNDLLRGQRAEGARRAA
jgi:putative DNA primase/helicase